MAYNDIHLQLITSLILAFLVVNFDFAVPMTFLIFAFLSLFLYGADTYVSYKTEKSGNRILQIVYASIAYLAFNVIATLVLSFAESVASATSAFSIFNDSLFQFFAQTTPALAENAFIALAVWGILIPIVETDLFFGRLFEFFVDKMKVTVSLSNIKTWAVIFIIGGIFTLFHITAKGITNDAALLLTFLFGVLSTVVVIYFGQTIEAKFLHIIANSTALVIGAGLALTNIAILAVFAMVLLIHLYPVIKYQLRGILPFA